MDLSFTKEEQAFREEVRQFFRDNVPPETRRKLVEGRHLSKDEMVTWWRILNKKGWGVTHWRPGRSPGNCRSPTSCGSRTASRTAASSATWPTTH